MLYYKNKEIERYVKHVGWIYNLTKFNYRHVPLIMTMVSSSHFVQSDAYDELTTVYALHIF